MLIPSIDLMGGKIVQLVQGERKALEFSDFDYWIERFAGYPVVQLIDLDGAMGKGRPVFWLTTSLKQFGPLDEFLKSIVVAAAAVSGNTFRSIPWWRDTNGFTR